MRREVLNSLMLFGISGLNYPKCGVKVYKLIGN